MTPMTPQEVAEKIINERAKLSKKHNSENYKSLRKWNDWN